MLTDTQQGILSFMRKYQEDHRALNCATLEEIAKAVGLHSRSAAQWHVRRLEEKGYVTRLPDVGYRKYLAVPADNPGKPDPESQGADDKTGNVHTKTDSGLREVST